MKIFYSEAHRLRDAKTELCGGELVTPFECPRRVELIRECCLRRGFGEFVHPASPSVALPEVVHAPDYVRFIDECWVDWRAAGYRGEALAAVWPSRAMPRQVVPRNIGGRIGYYALAAETAICAGTAEAARAAAGCAAAAAAAVAAGDGAAFALCRPPGHHAATDMFGGYCFFNNAAIAAQQLLAAGCGRVAVVDVDFHHGNGTQEIFYGRGDVLFVSVHGDPACAFPYFLGYADECGAGAGAGLTANYPLPPGTAFERWREALSDGLGRVRAFAPDALVVSLGVDAFVGDPISFFRLESADFLRCGGDLGGLGLPTVLVMEGGYAVEEIGENVVNVLEGFVAEGR